MRFGQVGMWAAAMVLAAGVSAPLAHADGVPIDPNITIHKIQGGGDPMGPGTGDAQSNPLIIDDGSGLNTFTYTGPDTSVFYVEIVPAPGESDAFFESEIFKCTPGAAADCGGVSPAGPLPAFEFVFTGPFTVDGVSVPDIVNGDTLQVGAPEPTTVLLLLVGMASLVGFSLKRRQVTVS